MARVGLKLAEVHVDGPPLSCDTLAAEVGEWQRVGLQRGCGCAGALCQIAAWLRTGLFKSVCAQGF